MIHHWLLVPGGTASKDIACDVQVSAGRKLEDRADMPTRTPSLGKKQGKLGSRKGGSSQNQGARG